MCAIWEEIEGKKGMYRLITDRVGPARSSILSAAEQLRGSCLFDSLSPPEGGSDEGSDS